MEDGTVTELKAQARKHGILEAEVVSAWEEMQRTYRLPAYVQATLVTTPDGSIMLQPAVNINLLDRVMQEVPDFDRISGPTWRR